MPTKTYDETIATLRQAVEHARLGRTDKLRSIRALHELAERVEETAAPQADVRRVIARERALSPRLGGRTAGDGPSRGEQLELFSD